MSPSFQSRISPSTRLFPKLGGKEASKTESAKGDTSEYVCGCIDSGLIASVEEEVPAFSSKSGLI
jgi:hypothetical protein